MSDPRRYPRVTTCSSSGGGGGPTEVTGTVDIGNTVSVTGTVGIDGPVDVSGTVGISGPVDVSGTVGISGPVDVSGTVGISGPITLTTANATGDAFGRLRVSNPFTLFEFNSILGTGVYGAAPSVIDTSSGGAATVVHSDDSYTAMNVTASGDFVYRQSHEYIPYQPGKSKLVMMTGVLHQDASDNPAYSTNQLRARIGMFDASMGIYVEFLNDNYNVVLLSTTGDGQTIPQANWDDPLNGNGPSGVSVDFSKAQIYLIDLEWLGVGQVRVGIVQGGVIHYLHHFTHINALDSPYTLSAKLPLRYEIQSFGSQNQMRMMCGSVISEGGFSPFGLRYTFPVGSVTTYNSTFGLNLPSTANAVYWNSPPNEVFMPMLSIRLKTGYPHRVGSIRIRNVDIFNTSGSNTYGIWRLVLNADVSGGTFIDYDAPGSVAQVCIHKFNNNTPVPPGQANHTYTQNSGIVLYNNFYSTRENSILFNSVEELISAPPLTVNLNGVSDMVTLVANGLNGSSNKLYVSVEWIEFV
jgi:hypothetical protein